MSGVLERRGVLGASGVVLATVAVRLVSFVFSVRVAHALGPAGVGVYASITTLGLLVGDVTQLGLPLWVMLEAAQARGRGEPPDETAMRRAHGLVLALTVLAFAALVLCAPLVSETGPERELARALAAGMGLAALGAFALMQERGEGRAGPTVLSHLAFAAALIPSLVTGRHLALGFLVASAALGGIGLFSTRLDRVPMAPRLGAARRSAPLLLATLLGLLCFSLDLFMATFLESAADRGRLQIATAITRTLASSFSIAAGLLIHRVERSMRQGRARAWLAPTALAFAAGAIAALVATATLEPFAALFRVELASVRFEAQASFVALPIAAAAATLFTLGLSLARRGALRAMALGVLAQAIAILGLRPSLSLLAYPVAMGLGSLVTLALSAWAIERAGVLEGEP